MVKAKIKERTRLKVATTLILRTLKRIETSIPPRSKLKPFHQDMLQALGAEDLERARIKIVQTTGKIKRLRAKAFRQLNAARTASSMYNIRKVMYGRISSEVRSLIPAMEYIKKVGPKLQEVPSIKFDLPTLVIAGCPNVGKTTLLKALTGSAPEIRPIPFTTQRIQLGYYLIGWRNIQVIDTPGLLDRPLEKRNPAELKAIGAIKHLSNLVIFMLDPTTRSGFQLDDQLRLLRQIRKSFAAPILVTINKTDIASSEEIQAAMCALRDEFHLIEISCSQGEGLQKLRGLISSYLIESVANY